MSWFFQPFNPTTPEEEAIQGSLSTLQPFINQFQKDVSDWKKKQAPTKFTPNTPLVKKIFVSHTQLKVAALTNTLQLMSLNPKAKWLGVTARVLIPFSGSMNVYNGAIGISGAPYKYLPWSDLTPVVADTSGFNDATQDVPNYNSNTSVIFSVSADANLSTSVAGLIEFWISYMNLS